MIYVILPVGGCQGSAKLILLTTYFVEILKIQQFHKELSIQHVQYPAYLQDHHDPVVLAMFSIV